MLSQYLPSVLLGCCVAGVAVQQDGTLNNWWRYVFASARAVEVHYRLCGLAREGIS